jgi:hypothetical protein
MADNHTPKMAPANKPVTKNPDYHKPTLTPPAVESVAGYSKGKAPAAAQFGVGGDGGAAQEARRAHGRQVQDKYTGPVTPGTPNHKGVR